MRRSFAQQHARAPRFERGTMRASTRPRAPKRWQFRCGSSSKRSTYRLRRRSRSSSSGGSSLGTRPGRTLHQHSPLQEPVRPRRTNTSLSSIRRDWAFCQIGTGGAHRSACAAVANPRGSLADCSRGSARAERRALHFALRCYLSHTPRDMRIRQDRDSPVYSRRGACNIQPVNTRKCTPDEDAE